ncbi:MAG: hypothetical protein K8S24_11625 [Candidatus Aegiribacteria sp.]|nr:hypothetical protein [Candidatus Aegiribacteria sp.]
MFKTSSVFLLYILVCAVGLSCQSDVDSDVSLCEELIEWREWLEASSPPEVETDMPLYIPSDTILSPEKCNYEYYMIENFVIDRDRIFLSDGRSSTLLAYSIDGELLWKTGGKGEGPGLFSGVGEIACNGDTLAVCNHGVGRIDYFDCDTGDWISSISILWPYDLCFLPDGNLVVLSLMQSDLVTIFTPSGERVSSFGSWDAPGEEVFYSMFSASNRNMRSTLIGDSILAVNSYFYNWCQLYNINSGELINAFKRELPFPEMEFEVRNGGVVGKIHAIDIASFGDMIAILHRPPEESWDISSRYDGVPFYEVDFAMVDIWDTDGEYIGSFAFPRGVGRILWHDGILYGATDGSGELIRFDEFTFDSERNP